MDSVKRIINVYNNIEKWFLIIMMAAMIVIIFAQVVTRYVLGNSLFWSEELGKFLFVWLSWIGVSAGMVNKEHIQITIVLDALARRGFVRGKKIMELVGNLCWMFTSIVILVYGMQLIQSSMEAGVIASATGIPMWIIYLCLPISAIVVCLRLVGVIYINICELIRGEEAAEND